MSDTAPTPAELVAMVGAMTPGPYTTCSAQNAKCGCGLIWASDSVVFKVVDANDDGIASDAAVVPGSKEFFANERGIVALRNHFTSLMERYERMKAALERVERWFGEFPSTGQFWDGDKNRPISFGACYGSNGERDYMRGVARAALADADEPLEVAKS